MFYKSSVVFVCSGGKLPPDVQRLAVQKIPVTMEKTGNCRRTQENSGIVTRSVEDDVYYRWEQIYAFLFKYTVTTFRNFTLEDFLLQK